MNYAPHPRSGSKCESQSQQRFTDVQLADLESTVHISSRFCEDRDEIGTPVWRSPEAQLGLQWGPPTDIWSFGTTVRLAYSIFLISIGDVYLLMLATAL